MRGSCCSAGSALGADPVQVLLEVFAAELLLARRRARPGTLEAPWASAGARGCPGGTMAAWPARGGRSRRASGRRAGLDLGCGGPMSVVEGILLAVSSAVFVYLGVAMFKPEWF
jgi:F subunit of K+-transporting ATPase (Potass_KdpF)